VAAQVPYQVMRAGPAILGGLLVPIMYLTVIELGGNNVAASIAAFMLLFGVQPFGWMQHHGCMDRDT
jgi:dolichyl-phosphate-mannose--protein O-mannosyl transferase